MFEEELGNYMEKNWGQISHLTGLTKCCLWYQQKSLLALTIYGIIALVDRAAVQDPIYPISEDLRNQPKKKGVSTK